LKVARNTDDVIAAMPDHPRKAAKPGSLALREHLLVLGTF
jgi:hypothetical protein